jgi:hypothetical protein
MISYILIVLHPKYKLQYFKNAKWETRWIDTAEELFRNQFNNEYSKEEYADPLEDEEESAEVTVHFDLHLFFMLWLIEREFIGSYFDGEHV